MKKTILLALVAVSATAQVVPPPATQVQVNAGQNRSSYVSPYTLANYAGGNPASSFATSNSITDGPTVTALNNFVRELELSNNYTNLVDALFFHPRFNATNKTSFFGRSWTAINPLYSEWGAAFYGTNGISLALPYGLSNYTIVIVQSQENRLPTSTTSGFPPGGNFLYAFEDTKSNLVMMSYETFFGLHAYESSGTNWPYAIQQNLNNQTAHKSTVLRATSSADPEVFYRGVFTDTRNQYGDRKMWVDTVPVYTDSSIFYNPAVLCTNLLTTLTLGTNYNWNHAMAGNPTYNTNYFGELFAVLIFNNSVTNAGGSNLVNSAYKAVRYLDPSTKEFFCIGDSMLSERGNDASGNAPSFTNSIFYRWKLRYPFDRCWHNYAQGSSQISTLVTNSVSGAAFPNSPFTMLPLGITQFLLTDAGRNDAAGGSNCATMTTDFNRFFGPIKLATGLKITGLETPCPWTNAVAGFPLTAANSNNLALWNTYMRSNSVIDRTIPMWQYADQVTLDTNKNNAITFDGVHIQGYGAGWKINDQIAGLIEGTPWPFAQQQGSSGLQLTLETNWVSGARYTNNSGSDWFVVADYSGFPTNIAGGAWGGIGFSADGITITTKSNGVSTSVSTVGNTNVFYSTLYKVVPNGWMFYVTNLSSGAGNSASFTGGTYTRLRSQ